MTLTITSLSFVNAAAAFSARASCTKPRIAFSTTISAIAIASNGQPACPSISHTTSVTTIAPSSR